MLTLPASDASDAMARTHTSSAGDADDQSSSSASSASSPNRRCRVGARAEPDWVAWTDHTGGDVDREQSPTADNETTRCTWCCQQRIPSTLSDAPLVLLYSSVLLNAAILAAAIWVYAVTSSQLVLAQAADSFLDVGANLVIAYAARVARRPADRDHLYGHQRAEPIGALIVAVITCVVALQVFASAIQSLATQSYPEADVAIAAILGAKGGLKMILIVAILFVTSFRPVESLALYALYIDTRNDIVACVCSLGGFALTKAGYGWGDGMSAIMLSFYVFYNGADLGNDNLIYIMGGAPEKIVMDELRDIAGDVAGVTTVGRIRAQFLGQDLQVDVCIVVPSDILAGEAHDVSVDVQRALEADDRVAVAFVHVDTDDTVERRH
mmetsp:Transcript_20271/g.58185  ORF Transcript_20271/g.58185 Transcript_20271/m.58185 type:complete len:382 (+) Transcript_20271:34-1179(+)